MRKYFGTDGVRGVANTELTCDLAYKLGRAGGYVLAQGKDKVKVIVGKDTRVSGDMLEADVSGKTGHDSSDGYCKAQSGSIFMF